MGSIDNSDTDSDTCSDTSSESLDDVFFYSSHAQSIFSNLDAAIEKLDSFLSFDRTYTHGDIVVSAISHPSAQLGRIVNVAISVDLENVFGKSVQSVDSRRLIRVRALAQGDIVISGPWIGRVRHVVDRVKIALDDGSQTDIIASESAKLAPISPNLLEDSGYPHQYHPGQRVKAPISSSSKSSGWLCGMLKRTHQEGVITSIEPGSVHVDWLGCALTGETDAPACIQNPEDLTPLPCFPHTSWLHGEYCILGTGLNKLEDLYSIVKKKMSYDVVWQDGSLSMGLESRCIAPITAVNATDFFPEEIVVEKGSSDDGRFGVVKSVDWCEKMVKVEWRGIGLDEMVMEEMVSAYELVEHPDLSFGYGDIVFLMGQNDASVMKRDEDWFLSSIGVVVGFKDGGVQVQWASGITTQVAPYRIMCMDRDEGALSSAVLDEESVPESNGGVTEEEKLSSQHEGSLDADGATEKNSTSFGLQQSAIGFLNSIAAKVLGSNGSKSHDEPLPDNDMSDAGEIMFTDESEVCQDPNVEQETEKIPQIGNLQNSSCNQHFKQFDIVADCSDHHFVNGVGKGVSMSQAKRGWLKKVQQEWSILERDLPGTIYVRIYEERMDLIRAAIIGASGTPYHDGLFFFDICLPPDYPDEPPSVYYHSGGLCLNPNLYESGRVCLSLLNTWRGSGSEIWNPGHSTILQVLLSLQALVLNEKPYFNEAGYDKQIGRSEGEKNSVSYNENAFLVSCKSMLYLLRNPPKHFEGLVEEHFQKRCKSILLACKAYMEGVPVGSFGQEKTAFVNQQKENSTGFRVMLAKLVCNLVEAFSAVGGDCSQFVGL